MKDQNEESISNASSKKLKAQSTEIYYEDISTRFKDSSATGLPVASILPYRVPESNDCGSKKSSSDCTEDISYEKSKSKSKKRRPSRDPEREESLVEKIIGILRK